MPVDRRDLDFVLKFIASIHTANQATTDAIDKMSALAVVGRVRSRELVSAFNAIGSAMRDRVKDLAELKAATHPEILREQVKLEKEMTEARLAYNNAIKQERKAQGVKTPAEGDRESGGGLLQTAGKALLIVESIERVAGAASPAAIEMFNYAFTDMIGVIGGVAAPIIETLTPVVRTLGDVLAAILPNMDEMREALKPLGEAFQIVGDALREVMQVIGPIIRSVLVGGLKLLGNILIIVAKAVRALMQAITPLLKVIAALFGIQPDRTQRTSIGAAARAAHFSDVAEYQKALQLAAFKIPGGFGQEDMPNMLNSLVEWSSKWNWDDYWRRLRQALTDMFLSLVGLQTSSGSKDAARDGARTWTVLGLLRAGSRLGG